MESINKVKMYRMGCIMSQADMANELGVSVNTYKKLEDNPKLFTLEQIEKYMSVVNQHDATVKAADIFFN